MSSILVIDDESNIRKILSTMLTSDGYQVHAVATLSEAKSLLKRVNVAAVLTDLRLKNEDGSTLLKWMREETIVAPVIILTAHGSIDSAVDSMKRGAFDYVSKPFEREELLRVIRKAVLTYQCQSQTQLRPVGGESKIPMIGQSKEMLKVFALTEKIAATDSTVLISGESGTGKELIAQAIHERSTRSKNPFIKINCAAIPQTLMESELFGYERGAFTGAVTSKPGRFELADGGTLFLDEIAEMCIEMQVKLLRVLQDGCFERVGGIRTLKVDVRLITATNKNLEAEVKSGKFREDLFYRLNVVPVSLPPLRERKDDIPLLVAHCIRKFSDRLKRKPHEITADCLECLSSFDWPGNIRQLENVMERMIVMNEGGVLETSHLPLEILERAEENLDPSSGSLKEKVKEVTKRTERRAIEAALEKTENNITKAAKELNISRKGLQIKLKELGIR